MLDIIFEDNHLLVLSKPANLATQPSDERKDCLEGMAKNWLKEKYQKPGNVYLHAIHRLDTPVSGVVVFAKTSKALSRLQKEIREKHTKKMYLAWVEGSLLKNEGTLQDYLIHGEHRGYVGKSGDPEAKLSSLHYVVKKRELGKTLVEIELITGRYHQIRVQFAHLGHPIWGDVKYGSKIAYPQVGIALHHSRFSIKHPVTGEMLVFEAPHSN